MTEATTAKITRKHVKRVIVWVVVLGAVAAGLIWMLNNRSKMADLGSYNSAGDIAAIETQGDGARAVIIKANGTVVPSPEYREGATDRDITWKPDGNRLFFVSDRYRKNEAGSYEPHVFRWNPASNKVERRTIDSRGKGHLSFSVPGSATPSETCLMLAGGTVLELDPTSGESKQVLPPRKQNSTQASGRGEEGGKSQFEDTYQVLGTSFLSARWCKDKKYIAAIMRRENGAELLMVQDTSGSKPPVPIAAADHISMDINPVSGMIIYTLVGFQFIDTDPKNLQQFIKNGKIVPPYRHVLGMFDPDTHQMTLIGTSNSDNVAFARPAVAPDGTTLAIIVGSYEQHNILPRELALVPAAANGGTTPQHLTPGFIEDASWDPAGEKLVFTRRQKDGNRAVVIINRDGSNATELTKSSDFSEPAFSPQTGASK
jgi:hypothetical protein